MDYNWEEDFTRLISYFPERTEEEMSHLYKIQTWFFQSFAS